MMTPAGMAAGGIVAGSADHEDVQRQLLKEAKLLAPLRHPNVVRFIGLVLQPPAHALTGIVLERASGGSAEKWLTGLKAMGAVSVHALLTFLSQVCDVTVCLCARMCARIFVCRYRCAGVNVWDVCVCVRVCACAHVFVRVRCILPISLWPVCVCRCCVGWRTCTQRA